MGLSSACTSRRTTDSAEDMGRCARGDAARQNRLCGLTKCGLFARDPQARSVFLAGAQPPLGILHVIARERHGVLPPGHLDLEHPEPLPAERELRDREIEFPHAAEALVIE